jgi:hypothetical protein
MRERVWGGRILGRPPRSAEQIAAELHVLLAAKAIAPPYETLAILRSTAFLYSCGIA